MKSHFKNYAIIYILGFFVLVFSVIAPGLEIVITGGFAWFTVFVSWLIGLGLIYVCVFGGDISFGSKGLIPIIKDYFKNDNNEYE